jgi:hypothetical protein
MGMGIKHQEAVEVAEAAAGEIDKGLGGSSR